MNYTAYKLKFTGAAHFGKRTLESANMTFSADRLFSALAFEASLESDDSLLKLINLVKNSKLIFSDAFPFADDEYFLPKPMIKPAKKNNDEDITKRKIFKKLEFLPLSKFNEYILGNAKTEDLLPPSFGNFSIKTSVCIKPMADSEPYRIGSFSFNKNCGLYILIGYEEKENLVFIENLLDCLSFSGIGGKRSAGYGRFELDFGKLTKELNDRLNNKYQTYMTLSTALPINEDMTLATDGARYLLTKKSGFIASVNYAPEWRRKRDSFAFQTGSIFKNKWRGELKDVSMGGNHAVYRYLIPLFMGVD